MAHMLRKTYMEESHTCCTYGCCDMAAPTRHRKLKSKNRQSSRRIEAKIQRQSEKKVWISEMEGR